ncbi:hypothetical protein [Nocardioides sp.]|uniref:hypothetical protein n=1 Tax=Nocardioides sp. TaxID=35761 RepID=UPI002629A650|nr:hypothetical protein [Nocardioides sp.]
MAIRSIRTTATSRTMAALLVLGASAQVGFGASSASAATAVQPSGGCWSYAPSGTALTAPPTSDVSTALGRWSPSGQGGVALVSSGPTADGSQRHVTLTVTDGPVLSTAAVDGTASVLLSVDGTAAPSAVQVPFSLAAGQAVTGLQADADLLIDGSGSHEIRLVGIYFDAPAAGLRVACNGQSGAAASPGVNPATTPTATDLTTRFTAVDGPVVEITAISDQAVTTAARPADVVSVALTGFASGAAAELQACPTSGACATVGVAALDADGAGTASFMMPGSVPAAPGTLRVNDGTAVEASTVLTVLGTQTMVASEKLNAASTAITFAGTGWDPRRDVVLQGHQGANGASSKTSDSDVVVRPDALGTFTATYTVKDADTVSVVADQARASTHIGSIYLTSGVVGSGSTTTDSDDSDEADDSGDGGTTTSTGGGTTTGSGTTTASSSGGITTTPTSTVPQTTPAAVQQVTGTVDVDGTLEISDIRLNGQSGVGDLFGGAPARTLVFVVTNTGTTAVTAPMIRVAVARSSDVTPMPVAAPISDLPVGGRAIVSVPVQLPSAALGTYRVVVQVGDAASGTFDLAWSSFPWGLLTLDAIGLALLIVGVVPWVAELLPKRTVRSVRPLALADGDAIVDLRAAERWWASRGADSRV